MTALKTALVSSLFLLSGLVYSETISTNPAANTDQTSQQTVNSHQYGARAPVVKPQPQTTPPVIVVVPGNNNLPQQRKDNRK